MASTFSLEQWLPGVPVVLWQCASASFAAYALLYHASAEAGKRYLPAYRRLSPDKRLDWNTRLPSTVHAVVVTALCLHQLLTGAFGAAASAADGVSPVLRTTPLSWAVMGVSLGYFLADGFMVLAHETLRESMMVAHHAAALMSIATAIDIRAAHAYVLFGLFTEVTTPFNNLRWRLQEAGAAKSSKLVKANGLALTVVWGVCRVLAFLPFAAHVWKHFSEAREGLPTYALFVMLGVPALLFIMNVVWFYKLVRGALKMLATPSAAQQQQRGAGKACGAGARRDGTVLVQAYAPTEPRQQRKDN